jgi:hypothetical protein
MIEARDPVLEERGRKSGLREEENYDLDDIESDDKKGSEGPSRLIRNAGIIVIIALFVILAAEPGFDSLNVLCHDYHVGNEDKQERDHGKGA